MTDCHQLTEHYHLANTIWKSLSLTVWTLNQ
jgi:hypothetical protein